MTAKKHPYHQLAKKRYSDEELANKWIKDMQAMDMSHDDMIATIRLARQKHNQFKAQQNAKS